MGITNCSGWIWDLPHRREFIPDITEPLKSLRLGRTSDVRRENDSIVQVNWLPTRIYVYAHKQLWLSVLVSEVCLVSKTIMVTEQMTAQCVSLKNHSLPRLEKPEKDGKTQDRRRAVIFYSLDSTQHDNHKQPDCIACMHKTVKALT